MKKFLLLCCLLPLAVMAQIGSIQTKEKPYEFIKDVVFFDKQTNIYYLHAQSDNQFEDKVVRYEIGTTPTEAVQSLANLCATFANYGEQFDLGQYTLRIEKTWLQFEKKGSLYYAAGEYRVSKSQLESAMKELLTNRGADPGHVTIKANTPEKGIMNAFFDDYGFKVVLYMDVDLTSILSRSYGFEDVLDDSDICALHNAAKEGIITKCPLLLQLCK